MIAWERIKVLVIDMDNTLCDTYHTLTMRQWHRVASVFEKRGRKDVARAFRKGVGKRSFVNVLDGLKLSSAERRLAVKTYNQNPVTTLTLFPDARPLLRVPIRKVLLSRGAPDLQRRKIRHLGIRSRFDEVVIVGTFGKKTTALARILRRFDARPSEVLVIGDRLEEEIADAKRLRMPAVLVRRKDLPVARCSVQPDLIVRSLATIAKKL